MPNLSNPYRITTVIFGAVSLLLTTLLLHPSSLPSSRANFDQSLQLASQTSPNISTHKITYQNKKCAYDLSAVASFIAKAQQEIADGEDSGLLFGLDKNLAIILFGSPLLVAIIVSVPLIVLSEHKHLTNITTPTYNNLG